MLDRTKATIIGYVGTTLSFMNNKEAWLSALQLAQCELGELDSFLRDLKEEGKEELEPLVDVIRDPLKLINSDDLNDDVDLLRNFILEKIKLGAEELLANPSLMKIFPHFVKMYEDVKSVKDFTYHRSRQIE